MGCDVPNGVAIGAAENAVVRGVALVVGARFDAPNGAAVDAARDAAEDVVA